MIEINEVTYKEIEKELVEECGGFEPDWCSKCENTSGFKTRYFILSRCPKSREEEKWLEKTMNEKFDVRHFGISAGVLGGDERAVLNNAVCSKCGSHNVFFDF